MAKGRKLTFDDDVNKDVKPFSEQLKEAKEEAVQAFEEKIESTKGRETPGDVAPADIPKEDIEGMKEDVRSFVKGASEVFDPEPDLKPEEPPIAEPPPAPMPKEERPKTIEDLGYTGPEPSGTNPIAPKLHETKDILTAQMNQRAQEYYDRAMREQFGTGTQQTQDLRAQIAAILKPNPDEDMVKSLVHFEGIQPNYIVMGVQPALLRQAWDLYKQYEKPIPGKFMEMVFDILNAQSRRYFHKVSIVELK